MLDPLKLALTGPLGGLYRLLFSSYYYVSYTKIFYAISCTVLPSVLIKCLNVLILGDRNAAVASKGVVPDG